jgi:hypothetical protein
MHTKLVARVVVLTGLALTTSSASASQGRPNASESTKTPQKHHARHKSPSQKRVPKGHESAATMRASFHHAEPTKTPVVPASRAEPMVFRTDGHERPTTKPAVLRGESKVRRSPSESDKKHLMRRTSTRDVSTDPNESNEVSAPPRERAVTTPSREAMADDGGDKHLLNRRQAVSKDGPETPAVGGLHAKEAPKAPCLKDAVEFDRGQETDSFPLVRCDGTLAPLAVERLSVIVRPESAHKPATALESLAKVKGKELSPGVHKIDPQLALRVEQIVDHFVKHGSPMRVSVVSGYRPMSSGSYHATGQALDLRIDGVSNESLVAFCKTLDDTGCGYYPNSSFVHVDVRPEKTGHVYWIDTSGPGEAPHYVSSWPPPPEPPLSDSREANAKVLTKLDRDLLPLPVDEHPAGVDPAASMGAPLDDQEPRSKR